MRALSLAGQQQKFFDREPAVYLDQPSSSQVDSVRVELGPADRVKVDVALEIQVAGLLLCATGRRAFQPTPGVCSNTRLPCPDEIIYTVPLSLVVEYTFCLRCIAVLTSVLC